MYKVHFRLQDEAYELYANSLDLSHPYFVSIKDFDFSYQESLVVNPHLENTKKRFRDTTTIMIPFQSVVLIEIIKNREPHKKENLVLKDLKVLHPTEDSEKP